MKGSALRGITSRQSLTILYNIMKRLYRQNNNMIGGVCGGIANFADIDKTIIRLLFAGLIFTPFPIIIIYILAWIITPSERI